MMRIGETMNKKVITGTALILLMIATTILAYNSLKGIDKDTFAVDFNEDDDADF